MMGSKHFTYLLTLEERCQRLFLQPTLPGGLLKPQLNVQVGLLEELKVTTVHKWGKAIRNMISSLSSALNNQIGSS